MSELNYIENSLEETGWHLARVKFLARFLVALIVCRSVCLSKVANAFAGEAQVASHYKRFQRFLRGFDLDSITIARLMLGWLKSNQHLPSPYILSLDRTNWKFGQTQFNILMLAVVYRGIAFPLVWSFLGSKGNSSVEDRQTLLLRYWEAFGKESISYSCKRNV